MLDPLLDSLLCHEIFTNIQDGGIILPAFRRKSTSHLTQPVPFFLPINTFIGLVSLTPPWLLALLIPFHRSFSFHSTIPSFLPSCSVVSDRSFGPFEFPPLAILLRDRSQHASCTSIISSARLRDLANFERHWTLIGVRISGVVEV